MTAVYTITIHTETVWAGDRLSAAIAWAQTRAAEAADAHPGGATPHLVIQTWRDGETDYIEDVHVYAGREVEAPRGEPTDADRLATKAVELLSTISPRNLAKGDTFTIGVWRSHVEGLADAVQDQYPGWLAAVQADRKAAR